jgi:protein ImuA
MRTPNHQQRLDALRDTIAQIERKPALAEARQRIETESEGFPVLPGGLVQEVFSDAQRDGGASLAFALGQARTLLNARRPALFYIQMGEDAQSMGVPYGPGLQWFGLDPASLFIVRTKDMTEFLWAVEEVVSCRGVAAMVADIRGSPRLLNFTASRRLSMRASHNRVSLFMLRYGPREESSASHLRWRLTPQRSGRNPYDDRALGAARWRLRLEKGRIAGNRSDWLLEWTKNGLSVFSNQPASTHSSRRPAPVHGSAPALLAHRLSEAG